MTNRETLRSLADVCEALSGPCRETDRAIQTAIDGYEHADHLSNRPYTGSIDAAMSLVPERWEWQLWHGGVVSLKPDVAFISLREGADRRFEFRTDAATPALALTAASLRAIGEGL